MIENFFGGGALVDHGIGEVGKLGLLGNGGSSYGDKMRSKIEIGWPWIALVPAIVFLHFMFCKVGSYPLTIAPFSLAFFLFVSYQINLKSIWLGAVVFLALPFLILAWSLLGQEHPDVVHYFRTYGLWSFAALSVLIAYKSTPAASGRERWKLEKVALVSLAILSLFSLAQVVLYAGWKSYGLYNPFGEHQYLGQYDASRFAGISVVRAPGFYLEPSFNAFVFISLYVICMLARFRLWASSAFTLLGLFVAQSMTGVLAYIAIWLLIVLKAQFGRDAPGKSEWIRAGVINLTLAALIAYTGGFSVFGASAHNAQSALNAQTRLEELAMPSTSGNYRLIAPLPVLRDVLSTAPLGKPLGQIEKTLGSYHLLNGSEQGKSLDNGMYLLIFYFGWIAVAFLVFLGIKMAKMISSAGSSTNALIVLGYVLTSLQFSGGILLPEYVLLLVMILYQFKIYTSEPRYVTDARADFHLQTRNA